MKHHCRLCELHCPLDELHCHRGLRACAAGPDFPDAEADAFAPGPQQEGRPLPPHPGPAAAEEEPRPPRGSDEPPSPFDRPPAPPGDPARPEAAPPPPFGRPDADVPPPHDPPPPFGRPNADVPPPHDPPPPFGRPDGELPPPPPPPPHRNPGPPPPFPPHDPPPPPRGPHPRPPHPDPEELLRRAEGAGPAELFELCHRALHRPEAGPLRGQGRALSILAERGEMSQRELQELLHVQPGSLSELLAKLERKGLLTRLPGEDRRARLLRITEAGRQAAEGMGTSADDTLFSALNGEQRAHFTEALRLLLADWLGRPAGPGDSASGREPLA